ncbi:MAG: hybrid sensor histidine kinase/response regulator [Acidimicrobiia bacterium]|jgi:signal transduction histidine kinase
MTAIAKPVRVLIVDDDPDGFESLSGMLADASFQVTGANDRHSALDQISRNVLDVVLVDHRIGSETGLHIIREAQRVGSAPPMILISGSDDETTIEAAVAAGAADSLSWNRVTPELLRRSIGYSIRLHAASSELRESRAELEKAVQGANDLMTTVNHDLRTPLSAIIGLAELLRDPEQTFDPNSRAEMIDTIIESGFEVSNLVEDLVTAARFESGQLKVVAVPVSIRAQVNQALETMGSADEIEVRGDASRALADPARVRQIIRNLLTNARRHGGDVVAVELDDHEHMARVTVVDDGPGIPSVSIETVFERHDRSDGEKHAFSGIGLPISRELARHMGGDLAYERRDGTRFELTLPRHREG